MNITYSKPKVILILTMLSMMGLLASDIYLPAMKNMVMYFNTSEANIQLTIGSYLLGLSIFQLIYGPVSDQIGRKPLILSGVTLYILGSIGCVLSGNITILICCRFMQAIGACSGLVLGRAIMTDIFPPKEITNIYNIIYPLVAASPAIAPIIGGYLVTYYGWKSNFIFVGLFGCMTLILLFNFPETAKISFKKISMNQLYQDYKLILQNFRFWGLVAIICGVYSSWFIYLTQSPFIFISYLNYTPKEVGYFYIPLALSIYIGNILGKKLKNKYGIEYALFAGNVFFLLGAICLYIVPSYTEFVNAWQLIFPMSLLAISNGFILPLGIPAAISLNQEKAGSGSGVIGFFQICSSAIISSGIASYLGTGVHIMSLSILFISICSCGLYFISVRYSNIKITI